MSTLYMPSIDFMFFSNIVVVRRTGDCLPDAEGGLGNGRLLVSDPCPFENFLWRLVSSRVVDGTGLVLPSDYPCCEYYIGIPINKKTRIILFN
jgi:hypothetical protein